MKLVTISLYAIIITKCNKSDSFNDQTLNYRKYLPVQTRLIKHFIKNDKNVWRSVNIILENDI